MRLASKKTPASLDKAVGNRRRHTYPFVGALEKAIKSVNKAGIMKQRVRQKAKLFDKETVKKSVMDLYEKIVQQE